MSEDLDLKTKVELVENTISGIATFDVKDGSITPVYMNEGLFRMLGYSRKEGTKYIMHFMDVLLPEDKATFSQALADVLKDDGPVETELRTVTASGNLRWLQIRANLFSRKGSINRINCVIIDATERKKVEEELKIQMVNQDILSASEGEQIIDYNAKTDVLSLKSSDITGNHTFTIIENYRSEAKYENIHPDDITYFVEIMQDILRTPKKESIEFRTKINTRDYKWYRAVLTSIADNNGYVIRAIGRLVDIHEKKLRQLELENKAEKDGMTELLNKTATSEMIDHFLENMGKAEPENEIHAFLLIDLDNFKAVNDYLGHTTGDEVIINTAERLKTLFKGYDIVGRIGGDEFVIFAKNVKTISDAEILASKICKSVIFHFQYQSRPIDVTCSVGISMVPYHGTTYAELMKKADKALYSAKANGKHKYKIFDSANTIAMHVNLRNQGYQCFQEADQFRSLEDGIFQIMKEKTDPKEAISTIVEFITIDLGFQRGYYIPISKERTFFEEIKYCNDGYENPYESNTDIQLKANAVKTLSEMTDTVLLVDRYNCVHENVCNFLMRRGVYSMIFYPVKERGKIVGGFCIENHTEIENKITEQKIADLSNLFRIIHSYLLLSGCCIMDFDKTSKLELLEQFDTYVYIIDFDTMQILYHNKMVSDKISKCLAGDACHKVLKLNETVCDDCPVKKMNVKDKKFHFSQEVFHYPMRAWMKYNISWFHLTENQRLGLVNCFDISEYFNSNEL